MAQKDRDLIIGIAFVVFILFVVGLFLSARHEETDEELARKEEQRLEINKNIAKQIVNDIIYIQDPRTNPPTCFAFFRRGRGAGLASVPCESISSQLLSVAK